MQNCPSFSVLGNGSELFFYQFIKLECFPDEKKSFISVIKRWILNKIFLTDFVKDPIFSSLWFFSSVVNSVSITYVRLNCFQLKKWNNVKQPENSQNCRFYSLLSFVGKNFFRWSSDWRQCNRSSWRIQFRCIQVGH